MPFALVLKDFFKRNMRLKLHAEVQRMHVSIHIMNMAYLTCHVSRPSMVKFMEGAGLKRQGNNQLLELLATYPELGSFRCVPLGIEVG